MSELLSSIRLIRSENVGPRTFFGLLKKFGSASEALKGLPGIAKGKKINICSPERAESEIAATEKLKVTILLHSDEDYPAALLNIYDPPPVLFCKGNIELLKRNSVAVVGTRNASANGCALARKLSAELGQAGVVVISGLARGIDSEAHKAALATGTVAVVAGGLDEIYPPENEKLFHKIAKEGLLISENPLGTKALARHFPQRNRIIAGLSQGVLVVEAAHKSGSMITADYALREGREVFAVPGSPLDPRCSGTNYLLKNGAVLVETAVDILSNLRPVTAQPKLYEDEIEFLDGNSSNELAAAEIEDLRQRIIGLLSHSPVGVDEIIQQTNAPPALVAEILLELEITGQLNRQYGNKVSLAA